SLAYWLSPRRTRETARPLSSPTVLTVADDLEDELIVELVKSEIARVCVHGDDITVSCANGVVRMEGPVLLADVPRILRCVARIPGIREIHDHLERHRAVARQPQLALLHADAR